MVTAKKLKGRKEEKKVRLGYSIQGPPSLSFPLTGAVLLQREILVRDNPFIHSSFSVSCGKTMLSDANLQLTREARERI